MQKNRRDVPNLSRPRPPLRREGQEGEAVKLQWHICSGYSYSCNGFFPCLHFYRRDRAAEGIIPLTARHNLWWALTFKRGKP